MRQPDTAASRLPPLLPTGARRPTAPTAADHSNDGSKRRSTTVTLQKAPRSRHGRNLMFGGFLLFIGLLTYMLVGTHHVDLPHFSLSQSINLGGSSIETTAAPAVRLEAETAAALEVRRSSSKVEVVPDVGVASAGVSAVAAAVASAKEAVTKAAAAKEAADKAAVSASLAADSVAAKAGVDNTAAKQTAAAAAAAATVAGDQAQADMIKAIKVAGAAVLADDKAFADRVAAAKAAADAADADAKATVAKAAAAATAKVAAAATAKTAAAAATKAKAEATAKTAAGATAKAGAGKAVAVASGGGCPELTKELVASRAKNNTIMLTATDWKIFETMGEWGAPRAEEADGVGYAVLCAGA